MKKIIYLVLLISVMLPQVVQASEQLPVSISADGFVMVDEESEIVQAEDNVIIEMGEDLIKADKVQVDLTTEIIKASGNILLIQDGKEVKGEALEFNYATEEGKFYNAETKEDKLTFRGKVIDISKDEMTIEDTELTPCTHEVPHYKLTAKEIKVYPKDKIVARGVHLWVKDHKVMPLPTYTVSLKEGEEGKKQSIPEPELGYNSHDGVFVGFDYDHYINQDLEGHISAKATTNKTSRVELDYQYQPSEKFQLNPEIAYSQDFGPDAYLNFRSKFGDTISDFDYNYYVQNDEDEEDYGERKWLAEWNLNTDLWGVDANLNLEQDQDDENIKQELSFSKEWSDYYWNLKATENKDINYKPEFTIGVDNKDLGEGTMLSTEIGLGKMYEEETGVEANRNQISLGLKNKKLEITDTTDIYWRGEVVDSNYDTGHDYRTYDLNLGLNQNLAGLDLNVDYQYYNELGESPFEFDALTEESIGRRDYLSASVGSQFELTDSVDVNWLLSGNKSYYENDQEIDSYGINTGVDYQIDDYNSLGINYNYRTLSGSTPIEDEEEKLELSNKISGTYQFQTNKKEFPYWDVKIDTTYDFNEDELTELKYSFTRELDCFNVGVELDQLEEEVNFGLEFKY